MKKLRIGNHKKLSKITIHFGQVMQFVGVNHDLKQKYWRVLSWYFSKHKYTEEELEPFAFDEPVIELDGKKMSRDYFQCFSFQSITDIDQQLTMNKGTLFSQFAQTIFNNSIVEAYLEKANEEIQRLVIHMSQNHELHTLLDSDNTHFSIENKEIRFTDILQKHIDLVMFRQEVETPINYLQNLEKIQVLMKIFQKILLTQSKPILIMFRNLDDLLTYREYHWVVEEIERLSEVFPNFHCILVPSQIGYVHVDEKVIDLITVFGEQVEGMEEFDLIFESIKRHYPDVRIPEKSEVLKNFQIIVPYLFSKEEHGVAFSVKQRVLKKILNRLYGFYFQEPDGIESYTELEKNYLFS